MHQHSVRGRLQGLRELYHKFQLARDNLKIFETVHISSRAHVEQQNGALMDYRAASKNI